MRNVIAIVATAALLSIAAFNTFNTQSSIPAVSNEVTAEFAKFQIEYGKSYGNPEQHNYRLGVFSQNYKHIEETNKRATTFELGVNQFADLTKEEFLVKFTGFVPTPEERRTYAAPKAPQEKYVDWTERGAVGPVKDQARCGSCWAFSTTGALEASFFFKHGKLTSLSEQQLVDCSKKYGNLGCSGGWMDWAMEYVKDHGVETEAAYSYVGREQKCKEDHTKFVDLDVQTVEFVDESEEALQAAVEERPISVAFNAGPIMLYKGGIFDDACPTRDLTHAVLLTGFGEEDGVKYWKIKNSWGTKWGEIGYFRMKRAQTKEGICGLAKHAVYPTF